ncbi:MAG: dihydrolipoyl dehydrogenase [Thermodesulfobacteriota bacterium]
MEYIKADVAIIGGGTAGMVAYRKAKESAEHVVLIEGGQYGTTCARVGCMPSKLLISAAEAVHAIHEAPGFGIFPNGEPRIDGVKVMERVRSERDRFVGFVLDAIDSIPPENKIAGYAKFLDNHTLQIDDRTTIEATSKVIATGSSPSILPMFEPAGDRIILNDDVFYWNDLPESVVVFGAGVIGLEIGQALHRLGVRTKILSKFGMVGPLNHPEIIEYAGRTFQDEFYLDTDADTLDVKKVGDQVEVRFKDLQGNEQTEKFDYLLAATGRTPNVKNLGLENTTLELDGRGVPLFDRYTLQCGDSSIFIAGDANNDVPLLHESADEGRIAGTNAGTYPEVHAGPRTTPLTVVFTDPQIALVGSSYNELKETPNCCFVTGKVSFENQGRSRVMLKNKGILYVYAEYGSGIFLGAEMFGPRAEHIAHLLAWARQKRMCITEMLEMPFYHPVIEEGLRTALRDANEKLHIGPGLDETSIECGPGI